MAHLWAAAEAMEGDASETMAGGEEALRHDHDAIDAIAKVRERELARGYLPSYRIAIKN